MAKKMSLVDSATRCDLVIERDAGNPVLILMPRSSKQALRTAWQDLKKLCDIALSNIEDLELPERS